MTGPAPDPATIAQGDARTAEIAGHLARVRDRVAAAAHAVGRDPAEVTLIAVTKTYPAADVLRLARLGVTDIGENRDQEAADKAAEVAEEAELRWHFVGQLQRNKARSVAGYAHMVHSVDSVRLATALGRAAEGRTTSLEVLCQVSLDGDTQRGGVTEAQLPAVAEAVAGAPALRLRGVMAVSPVSWRPRDAFARLAGVAAQLRSAYPAADVLSAGMSGDLEDALACGATHLRIGSALLGKRASLR